MNYKKQAWVSAGPDFYLPVCCYYFFKIFDVEESLKFLNDKFFHLHHFGKGIGLFHQLSHIFGYDLPA